MQSISLEEILESYKKDDQRICFFSMCIGSDSPFYDKACVEEGNFAWSDYKLGNTVFINPEDLYEEDILNREMFKFVDIDGTIKDNPPESEIH